MKGAFPTTFCTGAIAILLGITVHQLWAAYGPDNRCGGDGSAVVDCPAMGICQLPGHCGIDVYHKCITDHTFPYCVIWPDFDCGKSRTGCQFEEWTMMCGARVGTLFKPFCYGECL
jgi:hypothetical protein